MSITLRRTRSRSTRGTAPAAASALLAGVVLLSGALAACSGDDEPADGATSAGTAASEPTATSTLPVPDGVTLTPEGTSLKVGEPATVAYRVSQKKVGVLRIKVTRLQRTTFARSFSGWRLPASVKSSRPYFVTATFTNLGRTNLAGQRPPLYLSDGDGVLVESSQFASRFDACPSDSFPRGFARGSKVTTCLVYLVPDDGSLESIAFRPTQDVAAITWKGKVVAVGAKKKLTKKSGKR
ncbi:hypothetical protein [Nocardioides bruguierae]|uniref:hypothetical protein n=1 Tax=Nocardioides bruguierae TaxID=2945102 RepID=UPI002021DE13|nr:hypothetical protein [Nocardioides bruguierae]MCL8024648.1 hypothetical protein [Nocardioides bruguierae]